MLDNRNMRWRARVSAGTGGLGANPAAPVFGPGGTHRPSLDLSVSDEENARVLRCDGDTGESLVKLDDGFSGVCMDDFVPMEGNGELKVPI